MVDGRQDNREIGYYHFKDNYLFINIKVTPNSSSNKILGILVDGFVSTLKIAISVPAQNGKANHALIKYLSKLCKINTSSINIHKGELATKKLIRIHCELKDQNIIIQKIEEELEKL